MVRGDQISAHLEGSGFDWASGDPHLPPLARLILAEKRRQSFSLNELARWIRAAALAEGSRCSATRQLIRRWMRGRVPNPDSIRWLAVSLKLPIEVVVAAAEAQRSFAPGMARQITAIQATCPVHGFLPYTAIEEDDVRRKEFLKWACCLVGATSLGGGQEVIERLAHVLSGQGRLDQATLDGLERDLVDLELLERRAGVQFVLGRATAYLEVLTSLLQEPALPSLRVQLMSLAGEAAGLVGWLRWDADDMAGAAKYFRVGLEAAEQAGDRALGAFLVSSAAIQPDYRASPEGLLARLEVGVVNDASPVVRAWIVTRRAEALATQGRADDCLRALDQAETILAASAAPDLARRPRAPFPCYPATLNVTAAAGTCLARLGRPEAAEARLKGVLGTLDPGLTKVRVWYLPILASAQVQMGHPEQACQLVTEALAGAHDLDFGANLRMAIDVRRELEPFRALPEVMELDDRIAAQQG